MLEDKLKIIEIDSIWFLKLDIYCERENIDTTTQWEIFF